MDIFVRERPKKSGCIEMIELEGGFTLIGINVLRLFRFGMYSLFIYVKIQILTIF
jgi:hypothetical protein